MKFSLALVTAVAASFASAQTYVNYPNQLTCPVAGGTANWTLAELKKVTLSGTNKILLEKIAANRAVAAPCRQLRLPLYARDLGKGAGSLLYVYDSKNNAYTFCSADGIDVTGDGYPDGCS